MERLAILPRVRGQRSCSTTPPKPPGPDGHPLESIRRDDLPTDTVDLARFLIGAVLVRDERPETSTPTSARIVETEAYLPGDAGSHAFRGRTARNATMFGERGFAYIYLIYGTYFCLNVVSETPGIGAAVLLRAAQPITGEAAMRERSGERVASRDLLRGPGRLARAFGVDRAFDGADLCGRGPLSLAYGSVPHRIGCSVRIGLTKNAEAPLRFYESGHPLVSGPKRLAAN